MPPASSANGTWGTAIQCGPAIRASPSRWSCAAAGSANQAIPPAAKGTTPTPVWRPNGRQVHMKGYCTDVFSAEGMKWPSKALRQPKPFFLYLPTNVVHSPYHDVPADLLAKYQREKITADRFPQTGYPMPE